MSLLISDAFAAGSTMVGPTGNSFGPLLLLVGFIVIFYFLLWRPQSKRAKEHRALLNSLAKGDEVVTSGGLIGKISRIADDIISLTIAEGVEVKIQKSAISTALPKGTVKTA